METHTKQEQLSNYTRKLIYHKARQLVGQAGYTWGDVEDIEQELIRDLLDRMPKFDPEKACCNTFAARVVERKLCNLLRHRRAAMRDHRCEACSLNEEIETGEETTAQLQDAVSQDEIDLRMGRYNRPAGERAHLQMDVASVVAGLPSGLRQVAEMLRTQSVAEVSRDLGIPRRTFREKHLAPLRAIFAAAGLRDYLK